MKILKMGKEKGLEDSHPSNPLERCRMPLYVLLRGYSAPTPYRLSCGMRKL
jgi:hypothetical protein